jgi:uncharacterized cupin superfamily protein
MPKIDVAKAFTRTGATYPPPLDAPCRERVRTRLGDVAGLTQFGVNRLVLPPGAWSSQRHWHYAEDEFVYVLDGEVTLVTGEGEQVLKAGDCAGFKAGEADAHHLQNRADRDAVVLEVGSRRPAEDGAEFPDVDLFIQRGDRTWRRKDGSAY